MKTNKRMVLTLVAAGLLAGAPVFAASFTTGFSPGSTGYTLNQAGTTPGGYLTNYLGVNRAVLAPAVAGNSGSVTVGDFDAGQAIESFVANFKLQMGPGSGNAADGVSFNFGPLVYDTLISNEEGPGGTALTVSFDIYDNGVANEHGAPSTPALDIIYGGNVIATHAYAKADMVTSQLEDVSIRLTKAGKVSVVYKGQIVHTNVFIPGWAPTAGLFNLSARSGGEFCEQEVANLSISTVLEGTAVAPTILTNPASATVNEGGSTNFTVVVDGTAPFSFQWLDNDVEIPGATGVTLTMGPIPYTENTHQIKVKVSNPASPSGVPSAAAILTVIRDIIPPTVVKANADVSGMLVTVVYSEPVTDTALDTSNYSIDQGVTVNYLERQASNRVLLHTVSPMAGGLSYNLSIHGVQDTASSPPNTMVPTQVTFRTYVYQAGAVLHKKYANLGDGQGSLAALQSDPRYPNSPDRQDIMTSFEYPANGSYRDTVADPRDDPPPLSQQFSDTLEGFIIPPTTNDYVFFVTGADINDVYLSTDTEPANMVRIAQCSGWTNPRDWMVSQCGTTNGLRSDWYDQNTYPGVGDYSTGNALIHLDGGQKYYMLAFHHRFTWSGADDFAVTYLYATNAVGTNKPASGAAPLWTGSLIGTYLDPTGASVTFSQQPTNVTILQGRKATFIAAATGQSLYGTTVAFQWQTAPSGSTTFTNIVGETTASYTTPTLGVADSGRQYKLLATVPGFTQPSSVATVTVNADTIAPKLVSVAALPSQSGTTFDVGVTFDEPLDPVSAGTAINYNISVGSITAVKFYAGSPGVVLTVSGLTAGTAYSVTVANVADPYGNHITSANLAGTFSSMHWGVIGANEAQLGNGVVAVGPNAFDVYSDGVTEWGAYDEATFVYEQVTGDFDKEVRVEFQDASSQWARAGLAVRDVTNFGVTRALQEGANSTPAPWDGVAGRYQKVHVNPVTTAMGTPGNNSYECNRRLDTGSQTTSAGGGGTPQYPNAWCRLQRVGQTFNLFRSGDGQNWTSIGSTTWGVTDTNHVLMPDTVYVGLDYSPENGNVSTGFKSMFVAKYRDYKNHAGARPTLAIAKNPDGTFTLTYTGTLVSSDTANGTYNAVSGASSPWTVNPKATGAKSAQFYRARQ
jgi:hypothetical protein